MQCEEFRTTICPDVGSRIWAVSVLLIEGRAVRRLSGWRATIQQKLINVQQGKMCKYKCVAESPKSVAKPFESVADYGSAKLYIFVKVATSVGTSLRAV